MKPFTYTVVNRSDMNTINGGILANNKEDALQQISGRHTCRSGDRILITEIVDDGIRYPATSSFTSSGNDYYTVAKTEPQMFINVDTEDGKKVRVLLSKSDELKIVGINIHVNDKGEI